MRICRSRDSGITYSPEFLRLPPFITPLQRFSGHYYSAEAGVDMPAGQLWSWIFFLISLHHNQEGISDGSDTLHLRFHWYLLPHCSLLRLAISAVGIALAFAFKDNRAFCKYICPITVFLKPMSYFSVLRIKCDKDKCISCGKCKRVCPMNVDVTDNSRKRKNGTECILCMECVRNCPKDAL